MALMNEFAWFVFSMPQRAESPLSSFYDSFREFVPAGAEELDCPLIARLVV